MLAVIAATAATLPRYVRSGEPFKFSKSILPVKTVAVDSFDGHTLSPVAVSSMGSYCSG
jgi:hypothetical protein